MTMNIHFDTGSMSQEEAKALGVLLASIAPTMLPAVQLREHQKTLYGSTAVLSSVIEGPSDDVVLVKRDAPYTADEVANIDASALKSFKAEETAPAVTNTPRAGESAEQTAQRTRTRKKKDEPAPQAAISTGEERISPEDDAATAEQDKADEQAEIEAKTEQPAAPVKDLTINDVKDAMQAYVGKFGLAETQQDGAHIYNDVLGAPPAGEAGWRLSLVPADKYAAAVDAWTKAAQSGSRYVAGTFKGGA